jgi:hypothetical protein
MAEEATLGPPLNTGTHTIEECDRMLRLKLAPEVADEWLSERLLAMRYLAAVQIGQIARGEAA